MAQTDLRIDPSASCQANRSDSAPECRRCGRKMGEGCGEHGPYADPEITRALEVAMSATMAGRRSVR